MSGDKENINSTNPPEEDEQLFLRDEEGTTVDGIYIPPARAPACSLATTGPRLIITKIVNNFFKSYANNQALGPFNKCFNAIMGPNGSGKSNVIDSILFVFGYRAAKIRCKKVSVLIHNSEHHENVQSATVSVHFAEIIDKEGDDYEIVPGSEFVVSRTANKDNSSFYTLNDRRVHFGEVGRLLKKHGIDLDHNRFLILQGEVEQIAMMKCKAENNNEEGMLEYLEDIIETSRYIKPLEQLHERVDQLTDAKSDKVNRLKLVQTELEKLKEPFDEAMDFLKTENEVVVLKNVIYQKNIVDLGKHLTNAEEDKNVIDAASQELINKKTEVSKIKTEKEEQLKSESNKYKSLLDRKTTLTEAFEKANQKDEEVQAAMVQLNKTRKKTKELLAEELKKLEKYQKAPKESEKGIEECIKKEKELGAKQEKLIGEKTELLASVRTETAPLQEKKEVLETDLVALNRNVDETKSAYNLAESELKICLSNEETENKKYETLKATYENSNATLQERKRQVTALKAKIPPTEKSLADARNELASVREKEAQIRREVNGKRARLEDTRSSMQASKSRSKILDALSQLKADGKCPGFIGRLGDLGAIDQKYDVAISTACGALDNIVVDKVSAAQQCIEYLKKYNIGRATFIALEKQEHLWQYANSAIQTPENVPRLYNLVKVQDERVKTAFYYALRDTLVAKDLEQASRIAYGDRRYRVVTLEGQLIETSGEMSGGGRTVSRGRMGQSVAVTSSSPQDLAKMEKDLEGLESLFGENRQQQAALDKQMKALEPQLWQMKMDYEKYSIELQSLSQQEPLLLKQLQAQEKKAQSTKSDKVQVKRLTEIVSKKKAAYDAASALAQELQVQVDEFTKKINEKSTGKLSKVDKNIAEITKSMDKLKTEIARLRVSISTAERNAKKSTERIKSMEQDIKNYETRLLDMKAERDEIESDGEKLLKCLEEINNELSSENYDFSDLKNVIDDLKKKLNSLKSEEVDLNQRLKTVNNKINGIKSSMHKFNVKLSQLEVQEIPDISAEELKKYNEEELAEKNMEILERDLKLAENKVKNAKPNLGVLQEYRDKFNLHMERVQELNEISEKRQKMKGLYDKLREQRKQEFLTGFNTIRLKLKEMYQMIAPDGDAEIALVDTFDPFTEGIQFNVRPPKKTWKKISNLSGGEKTLSSLALVFALHYYKPSPLYVMDEIDAALDYKNVSIVGHYIQQRTKNTQFVIISLRSEMFECAFNLTGIYKTFNTTKSITVDPRLFDKKKEEIQVHPEENVDNTSEEIEDNSSSSSPNEHAATLNNVADKVQVTVVN